MMIGREWAGDESDGWSFIYKAEVKSWLHNSKADLRIRTQCSVALTLWDPCTAVNQVPLSVEFSRQEYWSGLPFPSPGDLLNPRIEPASPALASRLFTIETHGKLQELKTSDLILQCSLLRNAASPVSLMNRGKYYIGKCGQQFWGGKWFRRQTSQCTAGLGKA